MGTKPISGGPQPLARAEISTQEVDLEVAAARGQLADGLDLSALSASATLNGVGVELGVGLPDFDRDNNPELCARVSVLFFTLGDCLENPF